MMAGGGDSVPPTMPANYRDIVRERLATLDEQTRAVLSVAAVVGRRFDWTVLAAATGLDRERLLDRLRDGVRAHILTTDPTGGFEMPFARTSGSATRSTASRSHRLQHYRCPDRSQRRSRYRRRTRVNSTLRRHWRKILLCVFDPATRSGISRHQR